MELLIMWLGTVVASFGMEIANEMRMFKDVADNGYKIDIKRLAEFSKQMNPNGTKTTLLSLLIPILNIAGVLQRTMQYNNARPMILTQLDVMDTLVDMTKEEQEQYQAKPTGLNALVLTIKKEEVDKGTQVSFPDGAETSSIWFKTKDDGTRIIIKAEGPVATLSIAEQNKKLDEELSDMAKSIKEKYTEDELRTLLNDGLKKGGNFTFNISDVPVKEDISQPSTTEPAKLSLAEQREQLDQLRDSVLASTQEQLVEEKGQARELKPKQ